MALPTYSVIAYLIVARTAGAVSTCYDMNGNVKDNLVPCNPSADVSVCCTSNDYCLSNGLCLDAGGDNQFTVQGCTNSDWSSPCVQYCPDMGATTNWYQVLALCSTNDRVSAEYCCGENATCCETALSVSITLPIFTSAYKPGSASSEATTPTGTATSFTSGAATATTGSDSTDSTSDSAGRSDNSLAIGLGIGIPLGLITAGALLFLGWQMRRQNNLREQDVAQKSSISGGEFDTPPAVETQQAVIWGQVVPELHETTTRGELQADPRTQKWELPADGR